MPGSTKALVPTPGPTILSLATTILRIGAKGCMKVLIHAKWEFVFRKVTLKDIHLQGFSYTEYDTGPWLWFATGNDTNGTDTTQWVGIAEPGMLQLWSLFLTSLYFSNS